MIKIKTRFLYCFLAPSGAGKDKVTNTLCRTYGFTKIPSYTTRLQRKNDPADINNHIFINKTEFNNLKPDLFCYDNYDNNDYGATEQQAHKYNFYVVNASGIKWFHNNYHGDVQIKVIYLDTDESTRKVRMMQRGDNWNQINKRIVTDSIEFKNAKDLADIIIPNDYFNTCIDDVYKYICKCEGWSNT
jgi:guanylate kinase